MKCVKCSRKIQSGFKKLCCDHWVHAECLDKMCKALSFMGEVRCPVATCDTVVLTPTIIVEPDGSITYVPNYALHLPNLGALSESQRYTVNVLMRYLVGRLQGDAARLEPFLPVVLARIVAAPGALDRQFDALLQLADSMAADQAGAKGEARSVYNAFRVDVIRLATESADSSGKPGDVIRQRITKSVELL